MVTSVDVSSEAPENTKVIALEAVSEEEAVDVVFADGTILRYVACCVGGRLHVYRHLLVLQVIALNMQ